MVLELTEADLRFLLGGISLRSGARALGHQGLAGMRSPCLDRRHREDKPPQLVTSTIIAKYNYSVSLIGNEYKVGGSHVVLDGCC
ncbi:hypothetical protein S58_12070 [Bradyrhizobium oligotrophicum S58]|uniref:Uncharacterized protein n=1 Tax=Bradyrhizobium oligotrophicum S58 TaxID=1245469 RepID=M4Z366_9BRAD|nr:hypothetical protein S58_12070 [Bradyrhizobium oligotrophicum S58]